jgi:hypothetical protein
MHYCSFTPDPLQYRYKHKCIGSLLFLKSLRGCVASVTCPSTMSLLLEARSCLSKPAPSLQYISFCTLLPTPHVAFAVTGLGNNKWLSYFVLKIISGRNHRYSFYVPDLFFFILN